MAQALRERVKQKGWIAENLVVLPAAATAAAVGIWWFTVVDRIPPIEFGPSAVRPAVAHRGDWVRVTAEIRHLRQRTCERDVTRQLISSDGAWIPRGTDAVREGRLAPEQNMLAAEILIPYTMSWGPGRYWVQTCFRDCDGLSLTWLWPICPSPRSAPIEIRCNPASDERRCEYLAK
jgi:hypothetical protein